MFKKVMGLLAVMLGVASTASAALTVGQQAAVDGINTLISDFSAEAWPMVLAIVGLLIGIKLFKKIFNRAT